MPFVRKLLTESFGKASELLRTVIYCMFPANHVLKLHWLNFYIKMHQQGVVCKHIYI